MDDFVCSYCCTKLSMRYGQKRQGWTESVEGGLILLKASRAESHVAPKDAAQWPILRSERPKFNNFFIYWPI